MENTSNNEYITSNKILEGNLKQLILKWIEQMKPYKNQNTTLISTNEEILKYEYEDSKYTITNNDIVRTRILESKPYKNYAFYLKQLLVYYCEKNNLNYKQGLNEMMGIFLLLKFMDESIELYDVYNVFLLFVDLFFFNYYYEKDVYALKSSCALIQLLLRYHEPKIYEIFNLAFVTSEVYSTNWILTCFTTKNSFEISVLLYDFLIHYNDKAMIYYYIIAFFKNNREEILSQDVFHIIQCITKLGINDFKIANDLMETALYIKKNSPYSLYILMDSLHIFRYKSQFLKMQYEKIKPEEFVVFPIFASEVLYSVFPSIVSCPNYTCKNFENLYHKNVWPKKDICQCCIDKNIIQKNMTYFICDIRIFKDEEDVNICGVLPNMKIFPKSVLLSDDLINEIQKFINDNSKEDRPLHVIFISNQTKQFETYENKLYSEKLTDAEKFKEKFGLSSKKEKTLDDELVKNYLKYNNDEANLIKEYDNFRKIVKTMLNDGVKYVSFSYGGYMELHYLSTILKIPFTSHTQKLCNFCLQIKMKTKIQKSCITEEVFNKICLGKNNDVFPCVYNKTRNATIIVNESQILIFTTVIEKNKNIKFKLSHHMDKTSILATENNIEDSPHSISFLYSLNRALTDLVKITLDLLKEEELKKFLALIETFNITKSEINN